MNSDYQGRLKVLTRERGLFFALPLKPKVAMIQNRIEKKNNYYYNVTYTHYYQKQQTKNRNYLILYVIIVKRTSLFFIIELLNHINSVLPRYVHLCSGNLF